MEGKGGALHSLLPPRAELIDPEETPKNVMLRGVRRYDPSSSRCKAAAETLKNATRLLTGLDGD